MCVCVCVCVCVRVSVFAVCSYCSGMIVALSSKSNVGVFILGMISFGLWVAGAIIGGVLLVQVRTASILELLPSYLHCYLHLL